MLFSNDVRTEIARIFTPPIQSLQDQRTPLLYLIRKDLEGLYGSEGKYGATVLFPLLTCLGIMVGFELLAKMWSGNYQAEVKELASFLEKIARQTPDEAEALTQFRHALAHGYRLSTRKKKTQEMFTFEIDDSSGNSKTILEVKQRVFRINLWKLKELFFNSIQEYRRLLETSFDLQKKFTVCVANLGEIHLIH